MGDMRDDRAGMVDGHEERIRTLEKNVETLLTQLNEARAQLGLAGHKNVKTPRRT